MSIKMKSVILSANVYPTEFGGCIICFNMVSVGLEENSDMIIKNKGDIGGKKTKAPTNS